MKKKLETIGIGLIDAAEWNNLMRSFWGTARGRTVRFPLTGSVNPSITNVLANPAFGLGIKLVSPDSSKPNKIGTMIILDVYNGTNDREFEAIIMQNILQEIINDAETFKIAFSIGQTSTGELVILMDKVDSAHRLIGKGDGPGGGGLTPARIPAP
jgi:hypothetical protein